MESSKVSSLKECEVSPTSCSSGPISKIEKYFWTCFPTYTRAVKTRNYAENPAQPVTEETPEDHQNETSAFQRKVEYFDGQNFATKTGDEYNVTAKTCAESLVN